MTATVNPVIKVPVLEKPLSTVPAVPRQIGSSERFASAWAITGRAEAAPAAPAAAPGAFAGGVLVSNRDSGGNHF